MSADTEPRRLTPTERLERDRERLHEITLAFAQRTAAPPEHSCDVTRNAKGHYQFTITVRGHDLSEVLNGAFDSARKLAEQFPYPDENGGA